LQKRVCVLNTTAAAAAKVAQHAHAYFYLPRDAGCMCVCVCVFVCAVVQSAQSGFLNQASSTRLAQRHKHRP
jgi:hypothetical protein